MTIGWIIVALAFPFIVVAALAFPFHVVARYRAIRRGESYDERRFGKRILFGGVALYVVIVAALVAPGSLPLFERFMRAGGFALIVPMIFINVVLGSVLTEERARRKASPPRAKLR